MPPSLRGQLAAWLDANRSRRCKIIDGTADSPEAGSIGTIDIKMAAGKAADLEYIRETREAPSAVSTFEVRAQAAAGESKSSWKGQVARTLDDVAGSPRVKIPWGPVTRAGEHLIYIELGGKQPMATEPDAAMPAAEAAKASTSCSRKAWFSRTRVG